MAVFQVFKNRKGEYRWRLRAANNEIIADSAESYIRKRDCLHGMRLVRSQASKAKIIDTTSPLFKGKKKTS
jgi:uncharacterized protein YegP (UPF0339 family)